MLTSSELFVKNKAPILHLFYKIKAWSTLGHWSQGLKKKYLLLPILKFPTHSRQIPYVLSLVLFDESINSVIAEDDRMVHVWGKTIGTLKSFENIERDVDLVMKAAKRERIFVLTPH